MYITARAFVAMAVGIIPVMVTNSQLIAWLWLALVLFVAGLDFLLAPSPRSIAAQRTVPLSVRLTEPSRSTLVLLNTGRRHLRGMVRDSWEPSAGADDNRHQIDLPAGERRRYVTALLPTRRGDRNAGPVTVRLNGPLGIAGRQLSFEVPARLRVLPEFASRKHLPSRLARLRELDGRSAVQMRGPGSEFDSLREYVRGDDVRSIDWRATARRQETVVRTWRPERDRHVLILLDTSRTSAARIGTMPRLDASIEAALLLSALASHAGDRVQVIAFDRTVRGRAAASTGAQLMPKLAESLATIEPALIEMDWSGAVREIQAASRQRALVVLLTHMDASNVDSGMLRSVAALTRSHQLLVASVSDPESDEMQHGRADVMELYGAAAAARYHLERESVAVRLRHKGIEVVNADPESLAPQVADAYLALKAAGKL